MKKNRIRLTESQLKRVIKESLDEYAGYDSVKQAYGEQGDAPYDKHIRKVCGYRDGYERDNYFKDKGRTPEEREKMDDRKARNKRNLDPLRLKQSQLHKIIKESVKKILKEHGHGNPSRNNRIAQLRKIVHYVAENLKSYYDFYEERYLNNDTCWRGRLIGDYSFIDVQVGNYQGRVGTDSIETDPNGFEGVGGVQVTGNIFDEYGTCLHDYVCACQCAPLGWMNRNLTPDELIERLLKDINKCGLYDDSDVDEY